MGNLILLLAYRSILVGGHALARCLEEHDDIREVDYTELWLVKKRAPGSKYTIQNRTTAEDQLVFVVYVLLGVIYIYYIV